MDEALGSRESQGGAETSNAAEVAESCFGDVIDMGEECHPAGVGSEVTPRLRMWVERFDEGAIDVE